jgi:hypothetical protein
MAKAAPSKKTAKAAKSASTGGKKARKSKRVETFNSYIHKVLKQVHPGACPPPARRARAPRLPAAAPRPLAPRTAHSRLSPALPSRLAPPLPRRDWHLQEGHDGHELLCQ